MMHVFHAGEPFRRKMIHLNHSFPHDTRPDVLYFQQQYSPMVMRKFKKSLDSQLSGTSTTSVVSRESEDEMPGGTPLSTPRTTRRGRGGSFSGSGTNPDLLAGETVPSSPGLRRRRSRVPSEEDDKLINFLVAGGHDGSRERNTSLGNIGKAGLLAGWKVLRKS